MSARSRTTPRPAIAGDTVRTPATEPVAPTRVSSTDAQNEFGRFLEETARDKVFMITRHDTPKAILMSVERYQGLLAANARALDGLSAQFDELYDRMQTDRAAAGFARAFAAAPEEIDRLADKAARARKKR